MKKASSKTHDNDEDTLRPEYDFSGATRGATATRFREGSNVMVVDPAVLDVFPDGEAVSEALRAWADVIRHGRSKQTA